jgi:hypothetical protein
VDNVIISGVDLTENGTGALDNDSVEANIIITGCLPLTVNTP